MLGRNCVPCSSNLLENFCCLELCSVVSCTILWSTICTPECEECQGLVAEKIMCRPSYRNITGLIPVQGHFAISGSSKEFNLSNIIIAPLRWPRELLDSPCALV